MKYLFLVVLIFDLFLLLSIHMSGQAWALQVCRNAFGLCEYDTGLKVVAVLAAALALLMRDY